jgi:hypothetical protein
MSGDDERAAKHFFLAVRVGFEPTEPVKVQRFSRPPDSTALAPHRADTTHDSSFRYQPSTVANMSGATIDASDSITYFGVSILSFSHVIFSFGMAPE